MAARPITKRVDASSGNDAATSICQVKDSDARIAEANERTAKLLTQIQPRDLTAAQQDEIVAAIRPFASQGRFIQLSVAGDSEARRLSQIIDSILDRAGMKPPGRGSFSGGILPEGIQVLVNLAIPKICRA